MAVAGKAAITLDGEWSDTKDYDRLTGVTFNNSLYISRKKPPIGTAPAEGEYWMLCIEGVNEQDLDALAARVIDIENGIDDYGTADISAIGDGTVKGAILDMSENGKLKTYTQIADFGLTTSNTLKDVIKAMPNGSTITIDPWNPLSDFPITQSGYWLVKIAKGYNGGGYTDINATLHNANGSIARLWIGHYLNNSDTIVWVEHLPLTGGELTGSLKLNPADNGYSELYKNASASTDHGTVILDRSADGKLAGLEIRAIDNWVRFRDNGNAYHHLFGEHNKPTGTYTGNGSATARTINTGGIGKMCLITGNGYYVIVTGAGGIYAHFNGTAVTGIKSSELMYVDGVLTIASTNNWINKDATTYTYTCL